MSIFDKVLEIYDKYYICSHCLGRMFSLLGTSTTNQERGIAILLSITMENHRIYLSNVPETKKSILNLKLLAENANFLPAQNVLVNEGLNYNKGDSIKSCFLCNNIFSNLQDYAIMANNKLKEIEFNNFLVGTILAPQIINKDDILFGLLRLRICDEDLVPPSKHPNPPPLTVSSLKKYQAKRGKLAIIREIHVYGQALKLGEEGKIGQHTGLGKWLMSEAEKIVKKVGIKKISVISGVGVRPYYKNLGYGLEESYMVKTI